MRTLLWLLLLAALAAALSLLMVYNDGYVLLVLPRWGRVELSLNLLLILALAGFVLLHLLLRALNALFALPSSVRDYRARRAQSMADANIREAVSALLEGRYGRALRLAEVAYAAAHAPLLAALIAQYAAHGMRDTERLALWRERARQQDGKRNSAARLMTEAGIATENRDFETARGLLEQFARGDGLHVAAQRLALRVYQGLEQWQEVERLLRQLEKHHAMTPGQAAPLRQYAQRKMLDQLKDRGESSDALLRFLRGLPDLDNMEPRLVLHAVPMLNASGNHAYAARLIEDALAVRWDSDLAGAYGDCGGDTLALIAHAEKWLPAHARDARLLLTLGRLCSRQQLWGKAQSYLEASLSVQPSRWVHLELAALHDALGRDGDANIHFRAAAGEFK